MRTLFRFVLLRRCGLFLRGTYGLIAGVFLLFSVTASATAFGAARVAQLPLAAGEDVWALDARTEHHLSDMVRAALHMPLNGAMNWFADVDEHDLFAAYDAALARHAGKRGIYDYPGVLRETADEVGADIAVLPILESYSEEVYHAWFSCGDDYIVGRAAVRVLLYDRRTGEMAERRSVRRCTDRSYPCGSVRTLAYEAMREALERTGLQQHMRALRAHTLEQ